MSLYYQGFRSSVSDSSSDPDSHTEYLLAAHIVDTPLTTGTLTLGKHGRIGGGGP